jgi:hypothetical protein
MEGNERTLPFNVGLLDGAYEFFILWPSFWESSQNSDPRRQVVLTTSGVTAAFAESQTNMIFHQSALALFLGTSMAYFTNAFAPIQPQKISTRNLSLLYKMEPASDVPSLAQT